MLFSTGIVPLATVPKNTSKIRLVTKVYAMIVVADYDGQPEPTDYADFMAMKTANLFLELVATYRKHGWELRSALLQPATLAEFHSQEAELLNKLPVKDAGFDALWFSRSSHNNREAWELRLLAQTQYALFETFEADETEEDREDVKREMEARLRDYVSGNRSTPMKTD